MPDGLTEQELATVDIAARLVNLMDDRRASAEGAVAAAVKLAGLGAYPRSLTFLAALVRSGGLDYTLAVPDLMPSADQTVLVRGWLEAARNDEAPDAFALEEAVARWLEAVATVLQVRMSVRG